MRPIQLICATTVPFMADGELDVAGLGVLFRSILDSGVRHVFTPGTTGEFTGLSDEERLAVIEAALAVFGPEGVYAHVGAATARQAAQLSARARELGAMRLAAITPYFIKAGPTSIEDYYRAIVESAPGAEVYVYVFRARASTNVEPETLATLSRIPGIAGAKISGLSTAEVVEYLSAVPAGFPVYSGNDREFIRFARAGGAGIVSGVSGVFPGPFVRAEQAINDGTGDLEALQREIDRCVDLVAGGDFAMLKLGVGLRGLPSGPLRIANEPPTADQIHTLAEAVRRGEGSMRTDCGDKDGK